MLIVETAQGPVSFTFRHFVALTEDPIIRDTLCELTFNGTTYGAVAICAPGDNFNKAIGRKIALTRVLEGLSDPDEQDYLSKKSRAQIWTRYHNRQFTNKAFNSFYNPKIPVDQLQELIHG